MNRSNGKIKPIGVSGVLTVLVMAFILWVLLWSFIGFAVEVYHHLINR